MDNIVWAIEEHWDNGCTYPEDIMEWDRVVGVARTKEEANGMIEDLCDRLRAENVLLSVEKSCNKDGTFRYDVDVKDCFLGWGGDHVFTMQSFKLGEFIKMES